MIRKSPVFSYYFSYPIPFPVAKVLCCRIYRSYMRIVYIHTSGRCSAVFMYSFSVIGFRFKGRGWLYKALHRIMFLQVSESVPHGLNWGFFSDCWVFLWDIWLCVCLYVWDNVMLLFGSLGRIKVVFVIFSNYNMDINTIKSQSFSFWTQKAILLIRSLFFLHHLDRTIFSTYLL